MRRCALLEFVPSYVWFFAKLRAFAFRLHLDPRNAAAHAGRSSHELRLEIHAADGVHLHHRRRRLALSGARLAPVGFGRLGLSRLFTSRCRRCSIRERNLRRALIVSPNEHRRFHRHRHSDAGRRARRRDAAEAHPCGALSGRRLSSASPRFSFCSARSSSGWCRYLFMSAPSPS